MQKLVVSIYLDTVVTYILTILAFKNELCKCKIRISFCKVMLHIKKIETKRFAIIIFRLWITIWWKWLNLNNAETAIFYLQKDTYVLLLSACKEYCPSVTILRSSATHILSTKFMRSGCVIKFKAFKCFRSISKIGFLFSENCMQSYIERVI